MPTYEYQCQSCEYSFDVVKSITRFSEPEYCKTCKNEAIRVFKPSLNAIMRAGGMQEQAEYNPAFGKVIKSKRHRQYEADKRGMVEVGNDYKSGEKMQAESDVKRAEKRERDWDAV